MSLQPPYSPAIRAGDLCFVSCQLGIDLGGESVESFELEFRQMIANLSRALEGEGLGLEHLVKTTVFLQEIEDYGVMNDLYGEIIPAPYPSRSVIAVVGLPRGARIGIEAVAHGGA